MLYKEKKKREILTTHKTFIKTHNVPQTKHQFRRNLDRKLNFWITRSWIGPLNDENKLQVDKEDNKNTQKLSK